MDTYPNNYNYTFISRKDMYDINGESFILQCTLKVQSNYKLSLKCQTTKDYSTHMNNTIFAVDTEKE